MTVTRVQYRILTPPKFIQAMDPPNVVKACGWCMRRLGQCLQDPCDDRREV